MKQVAIIIASYNTREILESCLQNLVGIYPALQTIVVDNNSPDRSAEMVRREFPAVELVECAENRGLAAAYNTGLARASGDYALFLGPDAFPDKDTVSGMVEYLNHHKQVGIATCKLVLRDGTLDRDAHRGFPTLWTALTHLSRLDKFFRGSRIFDHYFMGYEDLNVPHEIDLCVSHFMFVRREVFTDIGPWDERFFVYGEDVDLCYRAKQAGWKIMYLPQWRAVHYKGTSVGVRKETRDITKASRETKRRMAKESTEAMITFYKKHYSRTYPKVVTGLVFLAVRLLSAVRQSKYQ